MRNRQNAAQITDSICSVTLFCSLRHEHLFEYPRHYPLRNKLCRASLGGSVSCERPAHMLAYQFERVIAPRLQCGQNSG